MQAEQVGMYYQGMLPAALPACGPRVIGMMQGAAGAS
jgi:hypothetical protein